MTGTEVGNDRFGGLGCQSLSIVEIEKGDHTRSYNHISYLCL